MGRCANHRYRVTCRDGSGNTPVVVGQSEDRVLNDGTPRAASTQLATRSLLCVSIFSNAPVDRTYFRERSEI
jgi:hypothetical protein